MLSKGSDSFAELREDGSVLAAGDNSCGQCDVEEWKDIVDIAAGDFFTAGYEVLDGPALSEVG